MTRLLVVLLVLWCSCTRRQSCGCPPGWYVNGARPNGLFECSPVLGQPQDDLEDAHLRREIQGPAPVPGWIWCTNGMVAQHDGLSVWCARP